MKQAIKLKNAFLTYFYEVESCEQNAMVDMAIAFIQSYPKDITKGIEHKRLFQFGVKAHQSFLNTINNY